jgi:alkanesulfonate monooxygenase SsuD/methylene tetrahydromethanopterin reductase-like flavin-dependent oxidoreductase (luciferase family)
MEFGYFTLSDNHYPNNPRTAGDLVLEIREQAVLADRLGFHSAWIGEHHFDRLGVNSRPDLLLASIVPETRHIRLAPAVNVLPLHHPLHVAESWATLDLLSGGRLDFATGRGYDRRGYQPFGVPFMASTQRFEAGIDGGLQAWTAPGVWPHGGHYSDIRDREITPKPTQQPIPCYIACFSDTRLAMAAARGLHRICAPCAAAMMYGGWGPRWSSTATPVPEPGDRPGEGQLFRPYRRDAGGGQPRAPVPPGRLPPRRPAGLSRRAEAHAAHHALLREDHRELTRHDQGALSR